MSKNRLLVCYLLCHSKNSNNFPTKTIINIANIMNYKNHSAIIAIIILLSNYPVTILPKNPLDVLGLDQDATDTEIKKKCRNLQKQFHADKGGSENQSALINMACDDLDWRNKDYCKINNKIESASCKCSSDESSSCVQGFTHSSIRCDCPLSDGTRVSDNCFDKSQACTCSNTGQQGTCGFGSLKNGLYCQCSQPNQQSSSPNNQKTSSSQTPPPQQDECEYRWFQSGSTCTCPNSGRQGTCKFDWSTLKSQCDCSQSQNSSNKHQSSSSGQQQSSSSSNNQQQNMNHDNCFYESQSCTCSNTGQSGTCGFGSLKNGLYCQCPQPSQKSSSSSSNSQSNYSSQTPPPPQDECESRWFASGSTCTCPKTGQKGTCHFNFTTLKQQCECSDDECENNASKNGSSCTCPDSGKSGTCDFGSMKDGNNGYRCNCEENSSQQNSKSNNNSTSDFSSDSKPQPEPTKEYGAVIVSPNIHAIIYNLGLQRSMNPTSTCNGWNFSLSPFAQGNKIDISSNTPSIRNYSVKSIEAGLLINAGYYGSWGYARSLFSLQQTNISHQGEVAVNYQIFGVPIINFVQHDYGTQSRFGVMDALLALGLKTNNIDTWNLNGECFIGFSDQRIKPDNSNKNTSIINHIPNLGAGAQVNFDWTISENYYSKYELSTLARFTCFTPTKLMFSEPGTEHQIEPAWYNPGSFLDLLLGLKQYYGYDYEHQIDLGYNPTIHFDGSKSTTSVNDNDKVRLTMFTEYIPTLRHTFYGTYAYKVTVGRNNLPITLSAGGTATFAPSITPYGTLFITCSLGF